MIPHPNLSLWLRDVSGALADISGNGHTVSSSGSPTANQAGQFGPAWAYGSTAKYHTVVDSGDLHNQYQFFALSFKRTSDATGGWDRIFSKDNGTTNRQYMLGTTGASVASPYGPNGLYWGTPAGTDLHIASTITNNVQNRCVMWTEPGYYKMILNGTLYSTAGTPPALTGTNSLYIGRYVEGNTQQFVGNIDNFMCGKFTCLEDMWRIYHMLNITYKV